MKLTELNRQSDRAFQELVGVSRAEFLEQSYAQVFTVGENVGGDFTPADISSASLKRELTIPETQALNETADKLNFLMTRFHLEGNPAHDERIRELALLRFEYLLLRGNVEFSQDPQLIADFFEKRNKPHLIAPVLGRLISETLDYKDLAMKLIDHPVVQKHLSEEIHSYKFQVQLIFLVEEEEYSKKETAIELLHQGFDLEKLDFCRHYQKLDDSDIRHGYKQYRKSAKEAEWLAKLIADENQNISINTIDSKIENGGAQTLETNPSTSDRDDSFEMCIDVPKYAGKKKELILLNKAVEIAVADTEGDLPPWLKMLLSLTADYETLQIPRRNSIQMKMWDHLNGGDFLGLAQDLNGANEWSSTKVGLNYNRWALRHKEHSKSLDPILAQDSLAMILVGDILAGDLSVALENLSDPKLKQFHNPEKLKASINLAWELLHHPGEGVPPNEFTLPRDYLFYVASEFQGYLADTASAKPYLTLYASTELSDVDDDQTAILGSISNLSTLEQLYNQLGISEALTSRFLEIFEDQYEVDTKYTSLRSEVRGIVDLIQDRNFKKYVDDDDIRSKLGEMILDTLARREEDNPNREESGVSKLVLTMFTNSVLRPYLGEEIDISSLVNGMIDQIIEEEDPLITVPYSLRKTYEIGIGKGEVMEAYFLANTFREYVDPSRMQRLVAYLLAINSDMTVTNDFRPEFVKSYIVHTQADPQYEMPEYLPKLDLDDLSKNYRVQFLSNVYEREKLLGGLSETMASIGVTNVIYRGTYVQPGRFYPRLDSLMEFLNSPLAELLPKEGPGFDALREYYILKEFLGAL